MGQITLSVLCCSPTWFARVAETVSGVRVSPWGRGDPTSIRQSSGMGCLVSGTFGHNGLCFYPHTPAPYPQDCGLWHPEQKAWGFWNLSLDGMRWASPSYVFPSVWCTFSARDQAGLFFFFLGGGLPLFPPVSPAQELIFCPPPRSLSIYPLPPGDLSRTPARPRFTLLPTPSCCSSQPHMLLSSSGPASPSLLRPFCSDHEGQWRASPPHQCSGPNPEPRLPPCSVFTSHVEATRKSTRPIFKIDPESDPAHWLCSHHAVLLTWCLPGSEQQPLPLRLSLSAHSQHVVAVH